MSCDNHIYVFLYTVPPDLLQGFNMTVYNISNKLQLFCIFSSIPVSQIRWYRRTILSSVVETLIEGNRTTILTSDDSYFFSSGSGSGSNEDNKIDLNQLIKEFEMMSTLPIAASVLEIEDLKYADEGNYSCAASNNISNVINSTDSNTAYVIVQRK